MITTTLLIFVLGDLFRFAAGLFLFYVLRLKRAGHFMFAVAAAAWPFSICKKWIVKNCPYETCLTCKIWNCPKAIDLYEKTKRHGDAL